MATQISTETKIYKKQLRLYKKSLRTQLLTSRFTTETSVENELYRKKYKMTGCVYCCPDPISKTILPDSNMFILEMNNDTNKIIGIGLIKNRPISSKLRVYNNGNYNKYTKSLHSSSRCNASDTICNRRHTSYYLKLRTLISRGYTICHDLRCALGKFRKCMYL